MVVDEFADALRHGQFHDALRAAIAHRGLSLARLSAHLDRIGVPVAESTLSYWQRGLRRPDGPRALPAVRGLEKVLGLPDDTLVTLVGPRSTRTRRTAALPPLAPISSEGPDIDDVCAELGIRAGEPDSLPTRLHQHTRVVLGRDGEQITVESRLVLRAMEDGTSRFIALYAGDPGCRIEDVAITAGDGCRIGRIRRRGLCAAFELVFDRGLRTGETAVVGYVAADATGGRCPGYYRLHRVAAGSMLLQIEFHPAALPARCLSEVTSREFGEPLESEELVIDRRGVVSAYFESTRPGLAGITLEWS